MSRAGWLANAFAGAAVALAPGAVFAQSPPAEVSPDGPATAPHVTAEPVAERRLHLQLDADAIFGIGGQMFLGTRVHLTGYTPIWYRPKATGTIDVGVQLLYGNEPVFMAPWLDPEEVRGATHHVQAVATVGHTFHLGRRRRVGLGAHLYGGLNHWTSSYRVEYPDEGVEGHSVVRRNHLLGGGQLELAVRLSRRVGLDFVLGAPFPTKPEALLTLAFIGTGLTFYLR